MTRRTKLAAGGLAAVLLAALCLCQLDSCTVKDREAVGATVLDGSYTPPTDVRAGVWLILVRTDDGRDVVGVRPPNRPGLKAGDRVTLVTVGGTFGLAPSYRVDD